MFGSLRAVRILVVVNPRATTTTPYERDVLAHALGSAAELRIEQTRNRGHAAALACRAMRDATDAVIVLGGDGTVNEVVNGLLTDGLHDRVPALGVIPGGATNVFARALGLPNDPIEAAGMVLAALRTGHRRPVSMGRTDDRWFIFAAGVGFDAEIIARVDKRRGRGAKSTEMLYARAGVREFLASDRHHPQLHLDFGDPAADPASDPASDRGSDPDSAVAPSNSTQSNSTQSNSTRSNSTQSRSTDKSTVDGVYYAVIANTDPWTYIGNRALHPTPQASFETGLDLFARTRMGLPSVALTLAHIARKAPGPSRVGSIVRHDLAELTVRCDTPTLLQVDGEIVGRTTSVRFTCAQNAISVVI